MQRLIDIVNSSGPETATHCERVSKYTKAFFECDNCGYTQEQIQHIVLGAYLHDIGKSSIDKNTLYKTSGITSDEMQVLRRHSAYGYEILTAHKDAFQSEDCYKICCNIALKHHRRIDGGGYPIISDDELELYVQIVSIIDVFDALTSKRCYQDAVSHDEALKIIASGAGGFFAHELIEKLKKYITEVM